MNIYVFIALNTLTLFYGATTHTRSVVDVHPDNKPISIRTRRPGRTRAVGATGTIHGVTQRPGNTRTIRTTKTIHGRTRRPGSTRVVGATGTVRGRTRRPGRIRGVRVVGARRPTRKRVFVRPARGRNWNFRPHPNRLRPVRYVAHRPYRRPHHSRWSRGLPHWWRNSFNWYWSNSWRNKYRPHWRQPCDDWYERDWRNHYNWASQYYTDSIRDRDGKDYWEVRNDTDTSITIYSYDQKDPGVTIYPGKVARVYHPTSLNLEVHPRIGTYDCQKKTFGPVDDHFLSILFDRAGRLVLLSNTNEWPDYARNIYRSYF